jgi:hypothetical protein
MAAAFFRTNGGEGTSEENCKGRFVVIIRGVEQTTPGGPPWRLPFDPFDPLFVALSLSLSLGVCLYVFMFSRLRGVP